MTYTPLLTVHIAGGIIGFLSGTLAMVARKGARLHRVSGDVFVVSMMAMGIAGGIIAFEKGQADNFIAGMFTAYLVATAWLTARRKPHEVGRAEVMLFAVLGATAVCDWYLAATQKSSGGYVVFGIILALTASGDVRMLLRGGLTATQRLVRHVWRTGVALFGATGSFFLGTASDPVLKKSGLRATIFTPEVRATHLQWVPVLFVVVLTLYWLVRVRRPNARGADALASLRSHQISTGGA